MPRILFVDEPSADVNATLLGKLTGYDVVYLSDPTQATARLGAEQFDALVVEPYFKDAISNPRVFEPIRKLVLTANDRKVPVVIFTSQERSWIEKDYGITQKRNYDEFFSKPVLLSETLCPYLKDLIEPRK